MKILLSGANGFIGSYLTAYLLCAGHTLTLTSRKVDETLARFPNTTVSFIDFNQAISMDDWLPLLSDIDCVINCVGVLEGASQQSIEAIHYDTPLALFKACKEANIKRVIHLSALGVDSDLNIDYVNTKRACDEALMALKLNAIILRPSLVYGAGSYGGTSLMRAMSALPFIPLIGKGGKRFQPIGIPCLMKVFETALNSDLQGIVDVVGPERISYKQILTHFRTWLGFSKTRFFNIPEKWIKRLAALGSYSGKGPLSRTSYELLMQENISDGTRLKSLIDFPILSLQDTLTYHPSQVQDRLHAKLYFLKPFTKGILFLLWILSGLFPLLFSYHEASDILQDMGFNNSVAQGITVITSVWDLFIAFGVGFSKRVSLFNAIQLLTIASYTLIATLTYPSLWLHPLGPLLKNIPIVILILIYQQMNER